MVWLLRGVGFFGRSFGAVYEDSGGGGIVRVDASVLVIAVDLGRGPFVIYIIPRFHVRDRAELMA
jgi:hypothetical protein